MTEFEIVSGKVASSREEKQGIWIGSPRWAQELGNWSPALQDDLWQASGPRYFILVGNEVGTKGLIVLVNIRA